MNKKKVVLSKAQYDLLSNIFSIKVDGECLFENVEGETVLDQLIGSGVEVVIEK